MALLALDKLLAMHRREKLSQANCFKDRLELVLPGPPQFPLSIDVLH